MYEIPPSVDKYLRISKKSRIHFPVVSDESSCGLNNTIDAIASSYPAYIENGAMYELQAGLYVDSTAKRKRSLEEYSDEQEEVLQSETKVPHVERDVSEDVFSWNNDYNKQHIENSARLNPVRQPQQRADSHAFTNGQHNTAPYDKELPNVKAKQASITEPSAAPSQVEYQGRSPTRKNPWGPQSYSELISAAIRANSSHQASLQQIYDWIVNNIAWFSDKGDYPSTKGWKVGLDCSCYIKFIRNSL